jgi:hypothetical protein
MPAPSLPPVPPGAPDPLAPGGGPYFPALPAVPAFASPSYTGTAPAGVQLFYSSAWFQAAVAADLGTTLQISAITGLPQRYPFKLLLEWGTPNQEIAIVTSAPSGNGPYTFTGVLRGQDGGGPQITHAAGAQVNHGVSAQDFYQGVPVYNPCDTQYAGGADPTGTIDCTLAINAAIVACGQAGGGIVEFPAGTFACAGTVVVNYNNVTLMGAGFNNATTLSYLPGEARQAAIVVGANQIVFNCNIMNLSVNASAPFTQAGEGFSGIIQPGSGHGIVFRSEVGTIQNVLVECAAGNGIHMALDNLPVNPVFDITMFNVYVRICGGEGVYVDPNYYDFEFTVVKVEGGTLYASGPIGLNGFNIQGGTAKFITCHPYYCVGYGLILGNGAGSYNDIIIGGEYENNLASGIFINGSVPVSSVSISGVICYGNASTNIHTPYGSQDITVYNATGVTITGCVLNSNMASSSHIWVTNSTGVTITGNVLNNTGSTSGIIIANSTNCRVNENWINTSTATPGQSVVIGNWPGGSSYCDVAFNTLSAGASEYSGSNNNRIHDNMYTGASGQGQFAILGANSVTYLNNGTGASSTITAQQSNYAATSAVTVATSAAITSLGSMSVPGGEPVPGAKYRVTAHGQFSIASAAPATTYICDLRWGGTAGTLLTSLSSVAVATSPLLPATTALTSVPILIEGEVEFRTASTVEAWLRMTWQNSTTAATAAAVSLASTVTAVTVTVSSAQLLSLDWTWGTSSASNTITISSSDFERVA